MRKTVKYCAVYPGTFDPLTLGHLHIVKRGLTHFDTIVIACSVGEHKHTLFSLEERLNLLRQCFKPFGKRVVIDSFDMLLVHYLQQQKIHTILRGIRTVGDFEYEHQMSLANRTLDPKIETVFMLTDDHYSHLSSSLIKEIAALGGNVGAMVPTAVAKALKSKLPKRVKS